jgi:hypothetical protein
MNYYASRYWNAHISLCFTNEVYSNIQGTIMPTVIHIQSRVSKNTNAALLDWSLFVLSLPLLEISKHYHSTHCFSCAANLCLADYA